MADSLNTIGLIATHLVNILPDVSPGISGNLVIIADLARQHVENYTGISIGSNSISNKFQPPILDFAKADIIDLINAQAGGEEIRLADLSISDSGEAMSADQYRTLGEIKLRALGKAYRVSQSLS